jgi:hypothetical protein
MHLKLIEPTPHELRAVLSMAIGTRIACSLLGLFFLLISGIFILASLPHTDFLTLERRDGRVSAWKSQALAGKWPVNSSRMVLGTDAAASVAEHEDEGSLTYRTVLDGGGSRWYLGKSLPDRNEAQQLADRINRFLSAKDADRFAWRKETWWWFILPVGLIGAAVGLVVIAIGNHQDRWSFNRSENQVTCRRHFLLCRKSRHWAMGEIRHAFVHRHTDNDGDTFNNIRLELQDGTWIGMGSISQQMNTPENLAREVNRINRLLGAGSQPVHKVDDRDPQPGPQEVEKQLQLLAGKHPRMAGWLRKLACRAHQNSDD